MKEKQFKPIEGIIVPLVTPLSSNNEIDLKGLDSLIEHVITGGVQGIFILGTTGEAQSLSFKLREEMIKETSRILKNRLPLLVGISDTSINDSIKLAELAYDVDAYAVVATAPYYFATGQPELLEYFENLISLLPIQLFLYNMPVHTKVYFDAKTIKQLARHEKVVGFKDSSANGAYLQTVMYTMRDRSDFMIFVGPEEMTAEMVLLGANGGVNGGANLFPKLYAELYKSAKSHNMDKMIRLQKLVMNVTTIYNKGKYGSSYLKGLKCALSIKGICRDILALPFSSFGKEEREQINNDLIEIQKALDLEEIN